MKRFYNKEYWQDYMTWGLAFGALLSLIDYAHDGFAQLFLVVAFFIFTGIVDNVLYLARFLQRYPLLIGATIIWSIWFRIRVTSPISSRMPIVVFSIIYAGYRVSSNGRESLHQSLIKLAIFIGVTICIGLLWHITMNNGIVPYFTMAGAYFANYWSRMSSIYMQPVPAGTIFLLYFLLCYLFLKSKSVRILGSALGVVAVWLSSTRSAMLLLVLSIIYVYFYNKVRRSPLKSEQKNEDEPRISRADRWIAIGAVIVLLVVIIAMRGKILSAIGVFIYRVNTFNISEAGIAYRLEAWATTIRDYPKGSLGELFLGRGVLQGYYNIAADEYMVGRYNVNAGPVENMFLNVLYDFGLVGFLLFVWLTVSAILSLVKKCDEMQRKIALILVALIGMSATYDLEYWLNTSFLIFAFIGLYLGIRDVSIYEGKQAALKVKSNIRIAVFGHKNAMTNEGGVEVVARELASRLSEKGNTVVCYNRKAHHVSGSEYDTPIVDHYEGIEMKYVPTVEKKGFAALTSSFGAAVACAMGDYDVVHVHAEGPAFFCWIPKITGKRVICQIHGLDHQRVKWGRVAKQLILWGEENAVRFADEILVLSKNMQDYFREEYGRETIYIPNAVNRPEIKQVNQIRNKWELEKDSYILFLGRMVPEKGVRYLIEAFKQIDTNKKLVIAGGSSDTDKFVGEMKDLAKGDGRIIFTGFVEGEERQELYSNAYVYVLPSDIEGMPLSLLEAMSYGNCCLVSDIEECAEVVEDKGVVFRHSVVDDLKMKLDELLSSQDIVQDYKRNASSFICEKYKWDKVVDEVEQAYRA